MKLIIDRLEGNYAVCEMEDRHIVNMPIELLPEGFSEGAVLNLEVKMDPEETLKRKIEINKLAKGIWV